MSNAPKILLVDSDASTLSEIAAILQGAGLTAMFSDSRAGGLAIIQKQLPDLVLLGPNLFSKDCAEILAAVKGSPALDSTRVVRLSAAPIGTDFQWLDQRADDVISRPWDTGELVARVRAQLRAKEELDGWREKSRLAEQGQQIAHTAFEALAVTEKMTADAFNLGRAMRVGLGALLGVSLVMVIIFLAFFRSADRETKRAYAAITRLERGITSEADMVERARKAREDMERSAAGTLESHKQQLEQQSQQLSEKMSAAAGGEVSDLQKQLKDTQSHLQKLETEGKVAQGIIRSYAQSVGLLHIVIAFRDRESGKKLRYGGITPTGDPLKDSEGNPIFDLNGTGPEVRADFFGTGFLASGDGRLLTNRHVVQPWWKNDELNSVTEQGFEPVVTELTVYFPGSLKGQRAEVKRISPQVDLAVVQAAMDGTKRPIPALDGSKEASVSGQPVVLMGYATGIDAILARAGEETVQSIVQTANGNPTGIIAELAKRNLIRPLTTQGHVGDVLLDKIVYDAQTTSGGSGGPVFNRDGKVIGVNYAVVRGFGGSNFGIPIRFAQTLLR
ncbi:MAG: trypsin-like peptidase domain-containing protein [Acidobacteria bacterium]|nr:trypsin-like peptidase domain-containing protein [Acidobacteriota bacterium]